MYRRPHIDSNGLPYFRLWGRFYKMRKRDVEQMKRFILRWEKACRKS